MSDIEIKNKHSNLNKLQISILETLSFIIISLEKDNGKDNNKSYRGNLKLEEYHKLEKLLLPSLSSNRNIEVIQKKAIQVFKNICIADEDGVWLTLSTLKNIIHDHKILNNNDEGIEQEKLKIKNNLNQLFGIKGKIFFYFIIIIIIFHFYLIY